MRHLSLGLPRLATTEGNHGETKQGRGNSSGGEDETRFPIRVTGCQESLVDYYGGRCL